MTSSIYQLQIIDLAIALMPLVLITVLFYKWKIQWRRVIYSSVRMIAQLIAIGFALKFIFEINHPALIFTVLLIMLSAAGWIALNPIHGPKKQLYLFSLMALVLGCLPLLGLIVFVVIDVEPWFKPSYLIPLAGMIFAHSMNAISISAERFQTEVSRKVEITDAKKVALKTALIPMTNMFLAVGLVSLPGLMTGQILSGVDPLIAVRYQIMILSTVFSSATLTAAFFLYQFGRQIESR
jgi:putative ABC transport system permease protein